MQEVVQLYLEGYSQEGIVKKCLVKSVGNVSNILRDFRSECEVDFVGAAAKYCAKATIERTHGLNAGVIEAKVGLKEAKEGAEFRTELRALRMHPPRVSMETISTAGHGICRREKVCSRSKRTTSDSS